MIPILEHLDLFFEYWEGWRLVLLLAGLGSSILLIWLLLIKLFHI